jgi:outer membrane immunogenic protein
MKKLLIASTMLFGLTGYALAADAIVEEVAVEAPLAFNWTGLYVGVHGGYSWGDSDAGYDNPGLAAVAGPLSMEPDGGFGGVQVGYNYHGASNFVFGLEAAVAYADISDTIPDVLGGLGETIHSDTDFVGTFRGRAGYAMDRFLPFVTGGVAVAHTEVSASDGGIADDKTQVGWTAGVGLEVAIDEKWSVSAEYFYTDLGDETWFEGEAFSSTSESTSNSARVAVNLRF